jgi:predicted transcriptional regulator
MADQWHAVYIVYNANRGILMTSTIPVSFRVSRKKYALLQRVASAYDRPKSWLLDQALDAFLEREAAFVAAVAAGVKDADAGRVVGHAKIDKWLTSWGTDEEVNPPTR